MVVGGTPDMIASEAAREPATALAHRLVFVGAHSDPRPWLHAADVLAMPSAYESYGLVVLEALACGVPVVATPTGCVPDVVTDGVNGAVVGADPDEHRRRSRARPRTRPGCCGCGGAGERGAAFVGHRRPALSRPADRTASGALHVGRGRRGSGVRILHAIRSDAFAGVESHVARLARAQLAAGDEVLVLGGDPDRMTDAAGPGVRTRPAATVTQVLATVRQWASQADVVHAHMTAAEIACATALVGVRHAPRRHPALRPRPRQQPRLGRRGGSRRPPGRRPDRDQSLRGRDDRGRECRHPSRGRLDQEHPHRAGPRPRRARGPAARTREGHRRGAPRVRGLRHRRGRVAPRGRR